jgi:gas vesicle protein
MNKFGSFILGVITGAAVGSVVGILFAPSEGKHTRDRLSYRLSRLQNELKELIATKEIYMNEAKNQGEELTNTTIKKAQKIQDKIDEISQQMKQSKAKKNNAK